MSDFTNNLKHKEITPKTHEPNLTQVIWSDIENTEFNPIFSDIFEPNYDYQTNNNSFIYINSEKDWLEDHSQTENESQYNFNDYVIDGVNQFNNLKISVEIPIIESEIIEPTPQTQVNSSQKNNQTNSKKPQNQSQTSTEKKKKSLSIVRLHEDIYENQSWSQTLSSNRFFQMSSFMAISLILISFIFPNQNAVIADKTPVNNQFSFNQQLNPTQNVLELNNLSQIKDNSSKKLPQLTPQPRQLTNSQLPKNSDNLNSLSNKNLSKNQPPSYPNLEGVNLQDQVIVDRYYFPPHNSTNQPQMTIVDRYYLQYPQTNQTNQKIVPQTESLAPTQTPIKNNNQNPSVTNNQVIPPPPPQVNSSIPTFTPNLNNSDLPSQSSENSLSQTKTYTLQGLINFADHSAAFFKIGDTIVRINQGEAISNNGWIFAKIDQQVAILSKNGETKTLRVGESLTVSE